MARNMADAWRTVPHISLFDEIDGRPLLDAHAAVRAEHGDGITLTAFFVRAAVVALDEFPILNASLDADARQDRVPRRAAHRRCGRERRRPRRSGRARRARPRAGRARARDRARHRGRARRAPRAREAIRGATFTVTNFGTEGGRFATPIVRPPQVAILGFGAVRVRPVVDGDTVVAAPTVPISLSADHRVIDGRDATGFLEAVAAASLAHPDALGIAAPRR